MELLLPVILVMTVGLVSGVLSSVAGAGGATLSTAGVRAAGTTPSLAIGSTLPAVLPSALVGSIRYARAGLVDWRVAFTTGGAGAVLAIAGALASSAVDARLLMVVTAAILFVSGLGVMRTARSARVESDEETSGRPGAAAGIGVGMVSGFMAGLLGLGGGMIVVPAFVRILRMPLRSAVGSSLVAVAILSVPALVAQSILGHVDWRVALALVVGVVPGARIGSRLALRASEASIAAVCGAVLMALASIQGITEVSSLIH